MTKLIEKYLGEGSIKAEARKALTRFESFNGNEKKILRRINAMKDLKKLAIFALVLEDQNFHDMVQKVAERYKELSGKEMSIDPIFSKGNIHGLAGY